MNRIIATTPLLLSLLAGPTIAQAQSADTVGAVLSSLGLAPELGNGLTDQGAEKLVALLLASGQDPLEIVASIAQYGDQQDLVSTVSELASSGAPIGAVVSAAIAASPSASAGDLVSAAIAQVAGNPQSVKDVVTAALDNGVAATEIASAVIIGNAGLANPTSAVETAVSTLVAADPAGAADIVEASVVALAYVATSAEGDRSVSQLETARDRGELAGLTVGVDGIDEIVAGAVYGAESVSASDRDLSDQARVLLTDNSDSVVESVAVDIVASVKDISGVVFSSAVADSLVKEASNGVFTRITRAEGSTNPVISNVVDVAAGADESLRNELLANVQQTQPAAVVEQVVAAAPSAPAITGDSAAPTDAAADPLVQIEGEPADAGGDVQPGAIVTGQSPAAVPPPASNNISAPSGGGVSSEQPASGS